MTTKQSTDNTKATGAALAVRTADSDGVARWTTPGGVAIPAPVAAMLDSIQAWIDRNGETASLDIMAGILGATSLDALDGIGGDTEGLRDLNGHRLVVRTVRYAKGDKPGGLPFYAIVEALDETSGRDGVFTTGATNALAFLFKCHASGWLPVTVTVKVVATGSGNTVVWLIPTPSF